jgi:hypothetical protein
MVETFRQNVNFAEACNCLGLNMVRGVPKSGLGAGATANPPSGPQATCPRWIAKDAASP